MEPSGGLLNKPNPKEQEQTDIFVANGIQIIHDPKVSDTILRQVKSNKDPIDGIASATVQVIDMLERHAGQKETKLSDATKVHGSNQLMAEIITLAESAGAIEPFNEEQKEQAYSLGVSMYLDKAVNSGKMSREELMVLSDEAKKTPQGQQIDQKMQSAAPGGAQPPAQPQAQPPAMPQQPMAPQGIRR